MPSLRRIWAMAAWELLREEHDFKFALEAAKNSLSGNPPERWSTGVEIVSEIEVVDGVGW